MQTTQSRDVSLEYKIKDFMHRKAMKYPELDLEDDTTHGFIHFRAARTW